MLFSSRYKHNVGTGKAILIEVNKIRLVALESDTGNELASPFVLFLIPFSPLNLVDSHNANR